MPCVSPKWSNENNTSIIPDFNSWLSRKSYDHTAKMTNESVGHVDTASFGAEEGKTPTGLDDLEVTVDPHSKGE